MTKKSSALLFVWFHIAWLGCVFLAQTPYSPIAIFFPLTLIGFFIFQNKLSKKESLFALVFFLIGATFDLICLKLNIIHLPKASLFLPLWLLSIWVMFTFVIAKNYLVLPNSVLIMGLLGAVFGPLSYKSGEVLNILYFSNTFSIVIYSIFWALYFPFITKAARRYL